MVVFGFWVLPLALVALLLAGASRVLDSRALRRFGAVLAGWLVVVGFVAGSGLLARFDARPPPFMFVLLGCVGAAVGLARSKVGVALSRLPLVVLVAFQGFRLPLEMLMHQAAREGTMPEQMTWTGLNWDVFTGISALLLAVLMRTGHAGRKGVLLWNVVGLGLLLNVVGVAVASTPLVHAFGTAPARLNTFVAYLPYTSLPAVMVVLALAGHLIIFRALRGDAPLLTPKQWPAA